MPTKKCPVEGYTKIIESPTEFDVRIKLIAHIAATHTKTVDEQIACTSENPKSNALAMKK